MLVLAIDTSSAAVTTAVVDVTDAAVVVRASRVEINARAHGELLSPLIADCLRAAGAAPPDLGALVVGTGPGPYTGLRVGLVTAAVLADALGIPAYGVCSLDAIGDACRDQDAVLVATDARRKEVYWARYARGVRTHGPDVDRPADVPVGDCTAAAGHGARLYDFGLPLRDVPYPPGLSLVRCARERVVAAAPPDVLTPLYLRRPDAEVPGTSKAVTP